MQWEHTEKESFSGRRGEMWECVTEQMIFMSFRGGVISCLEFLSGGHMLDRDQGSRTEAWCGVQHVG